jgi:predicted O-methyltransferase YrrM
MHSFRQLLIRWLTELQPRSIIEWGPGLSTELLLQHAPGAQIVSIEHCSRYHAIAAEKFGASIQLLKKDVSQRDSDYATCAYDHGPFDLAFIDGRRRVECALVALSLLRPSGVVIIHDWCRVNYSRPLSHIAQVIEVADNTAVLCVK